MRCTTVVTSILILFIYIVHHCSGWSGPNVCSRTECKYVSIKLCVYKTWRGCCRYKTVQKPQRYIVKFCCAGWTHNGNQACDIPVCNPPCQNGGTCQLPGKCRCPRQFTGPRCAGSQCSHLDPCYPGVCQSMTTNCNCAEGFGHTGFERDRHCLKLDKKPAIFQMQARLSYWQQPAQGGLMEKYSLLSDSTDKTEMDFIWTNRKQFNKLQVTAASQFSLDSMPPRPDYISASGFGIVSGAAQLLHTKVRLGQVAVSRYGTGSSERDVSQNDTLLCGTPVSSESPNTTVFLCDIDHRFTRLLETGDHITITFATASGGFRTLIDINTRTPLKNQTFIGKDETVSVEFRVDLEPPFHCQESGSCQNGEVLLRVQDITKEALEIEWSGWQDSLSGMYSYTLEVFPLNRTLQNQLDILKPLHPIHMQQVNQSGQPLRQRYMPPAPGMYVLILEAADLANNTKFVRRLVLYDPSSDVSTDPAHHFRFVSATPMTNFSYQNDTGRAIMADWTGYFWNRLHAENALLGKVQPYPPQLEDNLKFIADTLDDNEGQRTIHEIPNKKGIVKFELAYEKVEGNLPGSRKTIPSPGTPWTDLGLNQTHTLREPVRNGDSIIAYVRASDVLGNQLIENILVTFDGSPAEVDNLRFIMNDPVPGIDFSSTFRLTARDLESGIAFVNWTFKRSNGSVIYNETVAGQRTQSCDSQGSQSCYCTPRNQCFLIDLSYSLSNCHMMVEKENLPTEVISVTVDVINAAGLITTRTMEKGQLTMLNGTEAYYPPQNVRLLQVTETSVAFTWDFPPSCYDRTDIMVIYLDNNGQTLQVPIHKDARRYDLVDLTPDTVYNVQLVTSYIGKVLSDPQVLAFRTIANAALTSAAVGGIAVGVLLLLLLLVVIVILLLRYKGGARYQNLTNKLNIVSKIRAKRSSSSTEDKVFKKDIQEDDLYLEACQTWGSRQPWEVEASQLTLENQIASGKFADIYRATWSRGDDQRTTVVAKVLKAGFSSADIQTMMHKIQFFATETGRHDNVLLFLGAVLNNEFLGPVMLLEFCETGQLDQWLRSRQGAASEEVLDKLFRFSKEIACGMTYLASRKIVHNRLAARNILLTFVCDVKVAGFGPQHDPDNKVAAKWAAPEVLVDHPATEKSDVWSYGVTLWEMFSLGKTPYPDIKGREIGPYLKGGNRMTRPEFADDKLFALMQKCWQEHANDRPSFSEISKQLGVTTTSESRNSVDLYYATNHLPK